MALTTYGYVGGITSLAIVTLSYLCCVIFLARYATSRRVETLLQGIVFFAIGSNWLGVLISFLKVLIGGEPLSHIPMIRTWSWAPAATATIWIYQVLSLVRPKLKTAVGGVYLVLDVIYIYLMYGKTVDYSKVELVGGLPDSIILGIAIVFLLFYILTALAIIGPLYLVFVGFRSERPETQLKGKVIGVGVMLFAFFALFDTIIPPSAILLTFARIIILIAILLMYLGFTLPAWFRQRFLG